MIYNAKKKNTINFTPKVDKIEDLDGLKSHLGGNFYLPELSIKRNNEITNEKPRWRSLLERWRLHKGLKVGARPQCDWKSWLLVFGNSVNGRSVPPLLSGSREVIGILLSCWRASFDGEWISYTVNSMREKHNFRQLSCLYH